MNTPRLLCASLALFAALAGCAAGAAKPAATAPAPQAGPESPAEHDARMAWWREARFGMFVHWGLYSGLADTWNGKPNAGKEWLPNRLKHLDEPENEKADVLRGLRTYVKSGADNAKTFGELYQKLPKEKQVLPAEVEASLRMEK